MGNLESAGLGMTIGIIGGPYGMGLAPIIEKPALMSVKTPKNKNLNDFQSVNGGHRFDHIS